MEVQREMEAENKQGLDYVPRKPMVAQRKIPLKVNRKPNLASSSSSSTHSSAISTNVNIASSPSPLNTESDHENNR